MKGPFSTPVCTRNQKSEPSSADHAFSIANCNSRHARSAKALDPPLDCIALKRAIQSKGGSNALACRGRWGGGEVGRWVGHRLYSS